MTVARESAVLMPRTTFASGNLPAYHVATSVPPLLQWSLLLLVSALPLKSVVDLDKVAEAGVVPLISLPKLAGALFFCVFFGYAFAQRRRLRIDKTHALLLAFLVIACISTLQADATRDAAITTARYASYIALYWALTCLLAEPRVRARVVWTLCLACTATAAFALRNLLWYHSLIATTPHGDANDVAFLLAAVLPLACWLSGWQGRVRHIVVAMVVIIGVSILLSLSRGALLGLVAATIWMAAAERRRARAIIAAAACCALLVMLAVWLDPFNLRESIAAKQHVAWANVTNRITAWQVALRLAVENPLLGVGPGNFQFRYAEYWKAHPGAHALTVVHNSYLEIACELGVVAAALFCAFLATTFVRLGAVVRRGGGDASLALALRTSLVITIVAGVFVSEQLFAPYWLIAGIGNAVWLGLRRQAEVA